MANWQPLDPSQFSEKDANKLNNLGDITAEEIVENEEEEEDEDNNDDNNDDGVIQNEEEEQDTSSNEEEEETSGNDDENEEEVSNTEEEPKQKKHKSRAQERIRQLVNEKKQLETQANRVQELEEEIKKLRKSEKESKKSNVEQTKNYLQNNIETLNDQLKKAYEESDTDKIVDIQNKLYDANINLKIAEAWEPEEEEEEEVEEKPPQRQQQQSVDDLPEPTQNWVLDNPWFTQPKDNEEAGKVRLAVAINDTLMFEGYDPSSEDFYEELDNRLEQTLAKKQGTSVKSESNNMKSSKNKAKKDVKQKQQTVQGASRTSNSSRSSSTSPNNDYGLSQEEKNMAEFMGVSLKAYSDEKKRLQSNKKSHSKYVQLQ